MNSVVKEIQMYLHRITLTPSDPRWVGAWWIAYLVTSSAGLTVAFFMACFPKQLASKCVSSNIFLYLILDFYLGMTWL